MDFQLKREYFGVVVPFDGFGTQYSTDGSRFTKACAHILKTSPLASTGRLGFMTHVKLIQRNNTGPVEDHPDCYLPCYLATLCNLSRINPTEYEDLIRLACRFQAGEESLILVSVTSSELYCESWLDFAKTWPRSHVQTTDRPGKTVYTIMFPGRTD